MTHVPITPDRLVAWTQRFVRHPSEQTSLMEHDPAVLSFVTEAVQPLLAEAGLSSRIDGYGNLICESGPLESEMPLVMMAYAMTHPRNRMDRPFEGETVDRPDGPALRGRGVSEQKAPLASSLAAFIDVATSGRIRRRTAWVLLTAGETGRHDAAASAMAALGTTPRFGILAIGTGSRIALGNRGRLDVTVTLEGKACHSSTPWAGIDVTRGIQTILGRAQEIGPTLSSHPDLGPATLTCTSIRTGPEATHTVQSEATMIFDRRLMPGEDPLAVLDDLRSRFFLDPPLRITVEPGPFMYGSLVSIDGPLLREIGRALGQDGRAMPDTFYSPGSVDAGYLVVNGTEAVKWGPGDPAQFHTDEEQVSVADVVRVAEDYRSVMQHLVC